MRDRRQARLALDPHRRHGAVRRCDGAADADRRTLRRARPGRAHRARVHQRAQSSRTPRARDGAACGRSRAEVVREDAEPRPRSDLRIGIHHSALERNVRHRVEAQLRAGELHTVVCSSSLELGVDIGFIDRVCVAGGARGDDPDAAAHRTRRSPARRRGGRHHRRAGSGRYGRSRRDEALHRARAPRGGRDSRAPLDVLAQWLVRSVCYDRRLPFDEALRARAPRLSVSAISSEADLAAAPRYLSGGGAGRDEAHVRRLGTDDEALYGLGREVSAAFFENVGTIPDESQVPSLTAAGDDRQSRGRLRGRSRAGRRHPARTATTFACARCAPGGVSVEPFAGRPERPGVEFAHQGRPAAAGDGDRRVARRSRASACARAFARRTRMAGAPLRTGRARSGSRRALRRRSSWRSPTCRRRAKRQSKSTAWIASQNAIFHICAGRRVNETLARVVGGARLRASRGSTRRSRPTTTASWSRCRREVACPTRPGPRCCTRAASKPICRRSCAASHLLRNTSATWPTPGCWSAPRGRPDVRPFARRWNSARIFDRLEVATRVPAAARDWCVRHARPARCARARAVTSNRSPASRG